MFQSRPIFEPSPAIPSAHAATVVDLAGGSLLAAWFGGTHEGHPDVAIWLAHLDGERWSEPIVAVDEPGVPLWNPVLFRDAAGVVWLFFKVAPTVPAWTGAYIQSGDGGQSWSEPTLLPAGLLGPIKNKPIRLSNGDILCGTSSESWRSWACWVEISADGGRTWTKHGPIVAPEPALSRSPEPVEGATEGASGGAMGKGGKGERGKGEKGGEGRCRGTGSSWCSPISAVWDARSRQVVLPTAHRGVIQPTVWEYAPGRLKMLMRATQPVGLVCAASSDDNGRTWSPASLTGIPNPNSGLDAVRLSDGRIVLACNPTAEGRSPLSLLVSEDNGETWPWRKDLETEPGEYSYPSIIQAADGRIHVVYTYRRQWIQHAALDVDDLG